MLTDLFRRIVGLRPARPFEFALCAFAVLVAFAWPALADVSGDKRVALVIGNGAYQNAPTLDNAAFDARAVADAFRKLGFTVVDGYDLTIDGMRQKISEFSTDLAGAKSAVVYYAGHGISVDGENYLIPTDIALKSPTDLDLDAISVSLLLRQMKREERVNIVVLDACRDNPFAAALARNKTRALVGERGLSPIDGDIARGTLIAFASDPGSTALDGPPGQHSPFTAAFLDHVFDPGASIDAVMSRVRAEVWRKTSHGQLPWVNTSLIGDYVLNPAPAPEAAQAEPERPASMVGAPDRQSREDLLWESAQHSNLVGDYRAYLDAFPNGFFAAMARNRIAALANPGVPRSEPAPGADGAPQPQTAPPADWRAEIGTPETEKALHLTPAEEKEIQLRLTALAIYKGPATGALDLPTREAITEWQKKGGAALSSYLGPMQLAELRQESEEAYRKLLAAGEAPRPKAAERARPEPRAAARERAVRERASRERAAREEAAREPTKSRRRSPDRRPARSEAAAQGPAPAPRCNGNPQWCARAGLPVGNAPEPGRPPGFRKSAELRDNKGPPKAARPRVSSRQSRLWRLRSGGSMSEQRKYTMGEDRIPHSWYNIMADLPAPPPPVLHPGTGKPVGPDDLSPLFPMALIGQEVSQERHIEIPAPVRDVYRMWRPTPLYRARGLEKALGTNARIFYKYEGASPAGSHKPNTAVAQAFFNKEEGVTKLSTETGAGQWGSSLAFAGALFGLEVKVYMVKVSYNQKPYRRALMETYGARCVASPSDETEAGRAILARHPDSPGSLGIAISEAVEVAAKNADTKYALGSVLNHVLLHQTVIGIEAIEQMEQADAYPDVVIGCAGGGSNFAGVAFPFIGRKLRDKKDVRVIAVEPAACPTMTRGRYAFDFGDTGHLTPLVKMHTLGSEFIPPGFHAGGLRYHGMAPLVSHCLELGLIEARAYRQNPCFEAGVTFARTEGIVPAPEATHAVRAAMDEALKAREEGKSPTILFNLSGHGHFDMQAYTDYFAGKLEDQDYDPRALEASLAHLPKVAAE